MMVHVVTKPRHENRHEGTDLGGPSRPRGTTEERSRASRRYRGRLHGPEEGRLGCSPSRLAPWSHPVLSKMKTSERGGGLLPVLKHSFFHCFSIFSPHGIYYKVLPAHCFLNISVNISKQESKVLAVLLKAASPQH